MLSPSRFLRIARASAHSAGGWLAYRFGWHRTAHRQFEKVLLLRGADFRAYVHLGRIAFDQGDYASWRREFEHARRTDPIRFARLRHPMELFEPRLAGTQFEGQQELDNYQGTDARATWRALHPFGQDPLRRGTADDLADGHRMPDGRNPDGFGRGSDLPLAPGFDPLGMESLSAEQRASSGQFDERGLDELMGDGSADDAQPSSGAGDAPDGHNPPNSLPPISGLPDASLTRDDFGSAAERRRFQLRRPIDLQEIARCDVNELARRLSS